MTTEITGRFKCKNELTKFCYVCGQYIMKSQTKHVCEKVRSAYLLYFGRAFNQDKSWIPPVFCVSCYATLISWFNGNKTSMPFAVPALWREPSNHLNGCYFCMTHIRGFTKRNKPNIQYPDVPRGHVGAEGPFK